MNRFKFAVVSAVIFSLAVIGCSKGSKGPDSTVLAKVNRSKITVANFKEQIEDRPQLLQYIASNPQVKKDILDQMIAFELLTQEAKRQGLDKDAEYVKRKEWLKKEMERETQNILISMLLKKELAGKLAPPTDEEIKNYYDSHRKEMQMPDGKKVPLKDASVDIRNFLSRKKLQDASMEYANALKKNAKIDIDSKVLDAAMADISRPAELPAGPKAQKAPAAKDEGKQ